MSKSVIRLLILALSVPALAGVTAAQSTSSRFAGVPGLRPAVAIGDVPAIARTAETLDGRRVFVSMPAGRSAQRLGPSQVGDDGAPAIAALPSGDFLVVAARRNARGARLWAQRGSSDGWDRARRLRRTGSSDHHPALAIGRRAVWMTWVADDANGSSSLLAAAWDGRTFSTPERVPSVSSAPGVPAIALDANEQPAIVWSAYDGTDTEVWISRRTTGGWSAPAPLTDNDAPDEFPDIGRGRASRLVVSWSSFAPSGYQPFASREMAGGELAAPERLDTSAVGVTTVLGGEDDAIAWAAILPTTYELRVAGRSDDGWQRPARLGEVGSSHLHLALRGSRLLATTSATTHAEGTLRRSRGTTHPGADLPLPAVVAPREPRGDVPALPGTYRAFGDSITQGLVRFGGVIALTDGYPVPLGEYIASFLGREAIFVENAGVGGELTAAGLGRLAGLNASAPRAYTLIMEGANDVANLVDENTAVTNLTAMVRNTLAAGGVAAISTLTPRVEGAFVGGLNPRVVRYNDLIVPMAEREDALLVDQWTAFYRKAHLYSDLLHPNVQGYSHMAATWFRALQPFFTAVLQGEDDEDAAAQAASRERARFDRARARSIQ